ncbi:MAG: hypothetical protein HBSAPP02_19150 [Phycisphaerae bacterium]|nr:MAG: hypothetical protein HRU71_15490 [Planctomycetia bacterium]GJQ26883.1 MAG: hypothetical protein HBSAPP02_19150 [Phycisphaerae bacterium]
MSSGKQLLIFQVLPDELRLVAAQVEAGRVRLKSPACFLTGVRSGDITALTDQTVLDNVRAHVSAQGWIGRDALVLVGGANVACQYFDMPPLEESALRQAAQLKLAQQVHFDLNQAVVSVQPLSRVFGADAVARRKAKETAGSDSKAVPIEVVAAHGDVCNAALTAIDRTGLVVRSISALPAVFAALARRCINADAGIHAALYVDERVSLLCVQVEGVACVSTELPFGAADLTAALMRPIITGTEVLQLDEAKAAALRDSVGIPKAEETIGSLGVTGEKLVPLLEPVLQKLGKQLTQWLTFAATQAGGRRVETLCLVGPGAGIAGLADAIAARLKVPVRVVPWGRQQSEVDPVDAEHAVEAYGLAVAAALSGDALPDLLPRAVRRERRMAKTRRWITLCASSAAAMLALAAVMLHRLDESVALRLERHRSELAEAAGLLDVNRRCSAQSSRNEQIQSQMNDFARANPTWTGLFKELSNLLPPELMATQYESRTTNGLLTLSIIANVHTPPGGRSFDEIVSATLQVLQGSAFFSRVNLESANRGPQANDPDAVGTLTIVLDLNYPRLQARA